MVRYLLGLVFFLAALVTQAFAADALIIDHRHTEIRSIPQTWIAQVKDTLHIAYQHTSHGSQIITGMNALRSYPSFAGLYDFDDSGSRAGALDLDDLGIPGVADLSQGDSLDGNGVTPWVTSTRLLLDNSANNHINVIVWSWCSINGHNIQRYLDNMEILVAEYGPGGSKPRAAAHPVTFVFMTGHAEGQGEGGFIHAANQQIRQHCLTRGRVLFDFADIESYNPEGVYFYDRAMQDNLNYTTAANSTGNWGSEWIDVHVGSEIERLTTGNGVGGGYSGCTGCAHSDSPTQANINCVLKARAFWWLLATIAGWTNSAEGGDINHDLQVDLADTILALQVTTGISSNTIGIDLSADVNSDGNIGMAEVIYSLRSVAGLALPDNGSCEIPAEAMAEDSSQPDHVIGNGTPASCTSAAVVAAVAQGGIITFNCGPDPLTITMAATAKVFNNTGPKIVLDGGGKVTLSGAGARRILYMNTCDQAQVWTTSHCQDQDHPQLTVQNLHFSRGLQNGSENTDGGGAIWVRGGRFKIVNCRFTENVCASTGPDVGGAAVRVFSQSQGLPVHVVNSVFGGAEGLGNTCSNGGGLSSIGVSFSVVNSLFSHNRALGLGANPQRPGTPGGGSGGAIYNDGNTFSLSLCNTTIQDNSANEGGGAIFFVSNDRSGSLIINNSLLRHNVSAGFETSGLPGIFVLAKDPVQVSNSTIE